MSQPQVGLLDTLALACYYAQAHINDEDAWDVSEGARVQLLQCTSYQVACFLAQNTERGENGVEWDIVLKPLIEHPMRTASQWTQIIDNLATELGGWKE